MKKMEIVLIFSFSILSLIFQNCSISNEINVSTTNMQAVSTTVTTVIITAESEIKEKFNVNMRNISKEVLSGYDSMGDLSSDIEKYLKTYIKDYIKNQKENYFYYDFGDEILVGAGVEPDSGDQTANKDDYSTNNQVAGIDEADTFKSDGKFIFMVRSNSIVVISLDGKIIDNEIPFNTPVASLLLKDNKLIVISSNPNYYWYFADFNSAQTYVKIYNVDSSGILTLESSKELNGNYINARESNGNIYIVTDNYVNLNFINMLSRYNEEFMDLSDDGYELKAYGLAQKYLGLWVKETMDYLFSSSTNYNSDFYSNIVKISKMKKMKDQSDDGGDNYSFMNNLNITSLINIYSFNIAGLESPVNRAGFFTSDYSYPILYATADKMILGSNGWRQLEEYRWEQSTFLIGFNLDGSKVSPISFGSVDGYTINQFAIDYYGGYLRVASTKTANWGMDGFGNWAIFEPSSSLVTVFDIAGEDMVVVGQLKGLGTGETIYSVRFIGDKGFVVTFRQTDPFYSLDLSDPANPVKAGELKIPGFSSYLHPISVNLILGVGMEASDTGVQSGLKISLFDVSNLAAPVESAKYVEFENSYSDVLWDHKAFRYLQAQKLLIIPVSFFNYDYDTGVYTVYEGFKLYNIDAGAITLKGSISHVNELSDYYYYYYSYIQPRSALFSDNLITMKLDSVISSNIQTLQKNWDLTFDFVEYDYPYIAF